MDEIERRLAAVELLVTEIAAELSDDERQAVARRLIEGEALDSDDQIIRNQASALLGDAHRRMQTFTAGLRVRPEANDD